MLHTNTSLEAMSLFDCTDLQRDLNFYLALNRMGRNLLMEDNATKEDWFHVLVNSQVDLNCLYFFLSMKPELLDSSV